MKKVIRLTESDLNRIVRKVLNEQTSDQSSGQVTPAPQSRISGQYGPYCKIGESKGIIKQHTVGSGGANTTFGETGFGLFDDSGKLICKISTKYTQGGFVAVSTSKK
jgi:hypothetical protein